MPLPKNTLSTSANPSKVASDLPKSITPTAVNKPVIRKGVKPPITQPVYVSPIYPVYYPQAPIKPVSPVQSPSTSPVASPGIPDPLPAKLTWQQTAKILLPSILVGAGVYAVTSYLIKKIKK